MNLANKITIMRILLIPFFIAFVLYAKFNIALIIFVVAVLSDAVDGYIARTKNQKTQLGRVLDPLADKALIISAFICLSLLKEPQFLIRLPLYVPIVVISRDAIIIVGAVLIHVTTGKFEPRPNILGKVTTFFQMATVICVFLQFKYSFIAWNIAVLFTVISGAIYVIEGSKLFNGQKTEDRGQNENRD